MVFGQSYTLQDGPPDVSSADMAPPYVVVTILLTIKKKENTYLGYMGACLILFFKLYR